MKKFKKAVAMIMTLAMTMGVMSFTALAATELPEATNGVITLTEDTTISSWPSVSSDMTIDLAGHTLTYTGTISIDVESDITLTIYDSTASSTGQGGTLVLSPSISGTSSYLIAESGGTITVQNINITSSGTVLYAQGGTVNIEYCNIYTTGTYCVGTNATTSTDGDGNSINKYAGVEINIVGSTLQANGAAYEDNGVEITGDDCAVSMNVKGKLNIDNCTIIGNRQAVVVRAGTATIEDSEIIVTGNYTGSNYYLSSDWKSGNEVPAGALIVGNQKGTYYDEAEVTVTNTEITVETDNESYSAIYADANDTYTSSVTIEGDETVVSGTVTTGQYNADVNNTEDKATISISGGTYTDSSVVKYVDEAYYQVSNGDDTFSYYTSLADAMEAADEDAVIQSVNAVVNGAEVDTYTITFNAGKGTCSAATMELEEGATFELPTATRSGYRFAGWKASTNNKTYDAGYTFTVGTSDVEFIAQWTEKSSTTHSSYSLSETTGSSSSSDEDEEDNTTVTTPSTTDTTSNVFADLSTSHPYYDSIMTAYENGWMVGVSSDTFAAEGYLTRAMAAKILHNVADNPEATDVALFLDVPSGEWYSEAIAWAYEQGIVVGYDAQTFGPNDYVTVNQFCIMLAKYRGEEVPEYTGNSPYATRGLIAYMIVE